jgi:chromosome segregation ATPase
VSVEADQSELERELSVSRSRERRAATLLGDLRRRLDAAERRNAAILPLEGRIQQLEEELERRTHELRQLSAGYEGIVRSLSWRATAPLRAGKRLLLRRSRRS